MCELHRQVVVQHLSDGGVCVCVCVRWWPHHQVVVQHLSDGGVCVCELHRQVVVQHLSDGGVCVGFVCVNCTVKWLCNISVTEVCVFVFVCVCVNCTRQVAVQHLSD
jgi:hypothetical protein